MKEIKIAEPVVRNEAVIVEDIARESEGLGAAEQEFAGLEARRGALLTSGTLDEIHGLADSHARARLRTEIAQARLDALHGELLRFYATEARAALDAELTPIPTIDAAERQALADYETHARLVAEDLSRLGELQRRRHAVSVRIHRLNGTWVSDDSPTKSGALIQHVKLPSAEGGGDHWPVSPRAMLLDAQQRLARDAEALQEYRRGGE